MAHLVLVPERLLLMIALFLVLTCPPTAAASILRQATFEDNLQEAVLMLRFDSEPAIRYTPMTDARVLILDFENAAFPSGQERFNPKTHLVEYLSLVQFNQEKLRLVLKVAPGTVVNVYRYPVPGKRDVRYAVVIEKEAGLDRFPVIPGRKTRPRIVLDPGHGGHDNGAIGTITSDKEVGLAIGRELKLLFDQDPRVEVYFTRLSDHFVPLEDRSAFARKVDADCFVSMHGNMMVHDHWTKGVEVWYLSDRGAQKELSRVMQDKGVLSNSGHVGRHVAMSGGGVDQIILSMQQSKTIAQSSLLARILNRNLVRYTGQETRGVKRSNFRVLHPIEIPSCLVEFGFLSNPSEERLIASRAYHKRAARAVYDGILEWMARTGRLAGPQANRLIQSSVSEEEKGDDSQSAPEVESGGDRMNLGGR